MDIGTNTNTDRSLCYLDMSITNIFECILAVVCKQHSDPVGENKLRIGTIT